MKIFIAALLATTMIVPGFAQTPLTNPEGPRLDAAARLAAAMDRLAYRPDVTGVAGIEGQIAGAPGVAADKKAQADALRAQAFTAYQAGRSSEALRLLNQAMASVVGLDWTTAAYPASLTLDLERAVADQGGYQIVTLRQLWPETPSGKTMTLKFQLLEDKSGGAVIKDYPVQTFTGSDLIANPARFTLSVRGVPAGHYRLAALIDGKTKLLTTIDIVEGLTAKTYDVLDRLGKITGHDAAKDTIHYPFDLAHKMNIHQREVLSYDFTAEIARAMHLLSALEAGHDLIEKAKGDTKRAYFYADAGDIVPYRIYVPTTWDGKAHLPMIVALHGANLDENNMLDRAGGEMAKLAEARGYIIVAPLGYRMNSFYGAALPAGEGQGFGLVGKVDPHRIALSEQDVLNVADIVAKEYGTDAKRTYIMGNSMGGMGTWHYAAKFTQRWAAIAPAAGGATDVGYDYAKLKGLPIMAVAGELDGARVAVEATVAKLKDTGVTPTYDQVKGGTHGSAIESAMPDIFDFFAKNHK